jgi:Fe-S-cluster containining protein
MTDASSAAHPADSRPRSEIAVEIRIGEEPVQFRLQVPAGPATWDDLLPFMRALVEISGDIGVEREHAQGRAVSCRAGCSFCCRHPVPLAAFEAHRLRRLVEDMPEPRRTQVRDRFREVESMLEQAGLTDLMREVVTVDAAEAGRRFAQYFRAMIPCPFLENEMCSIHAERPLKCREYLVTTPAELCATPESGAVHLIPQPLKVCLSALRSATPPSDTPDAPRAEWVLLSQLFRWTEAHPAAPETRTGLQLFQHFMSNLTGAGQ